MLYYLNTARLKKFLVQDAKFRIYCTANKEGLYKCILKKIRKKLQNVFVMRIYMFIIFFCQNLDMAFIKKLYNKSIRKFCFLGDYHCWRYNDILF